MTDTSYGVGLKEGEVGKEDTEDEDADGGNVVNTPKEILKYALDYNYVLGLLFPFCKQPTMLERWLLFFLFLSTGLLMSYKHAVLGPVCRREYLRSCPGGFSTLAWNNTPPVADVYMTQTAPFVDDLRRLTEQEEQLTAAVEAEQTEAVKWQALFQGFEFDCERPMCGIYAPQMMNNSLASKLPRYFPSPVRSGYGVVMGYCICTGPMYDDVAYAKAGHYARFLIAGLIVQTLVPITFRTIFKIDCGAKGTTYKIINWFVQFLCLLLSIGIFIIVFRNSYEPSVWKDVILMTLLNTCLVTPLISIGLLFACRLTNWPLKKCGYTDPVDDMHQWTILDKCYRPSRGSEEEEDTEAGE